MDTFFAKNRLSAYLDGALPEREAAEVADAIARDPELQAEFEALRDAVAVLRQHGPVSAPEGFKARVMAQVERESTSGGVVIQLRRWFTRVPVEALAVAAAALLVVFATVSQMQSPPPQPLAKKAEAPVSSKAPTPAPTGVEPPADNAHAAAAPVVPTPPEQRAEKGPDSPPPSTQKTASVPKSSAATPQAAYVPEWEADPSTDDTAFGTIEGLSLSVSDPDVLGKLYVVTERAGGRMLDEANQPLRPYSLSADNPVARVVLMVPVQNAGSLRSQLVGLGAATAPTPASAPTLASGSSGFYVEARLLP
jgi:negative regulator of sigma E activity